MFPPDGRHTQDKSCLTLTGHLKSLSTARLCKFYRNASYKKRTEKSNGIWNKTEFCSMKQVFIDIQMFTYMMIAEAVL